MKKVRFYIYIDPGLKANIERRVEDNKPQFRSIAHFMEMAAAEKLEREKGNDSEKL